jgi:hypothetical protein
LLKSPLSLILKPMMFVYPAFLWALAVIAIPIIIHLFNFRRYKKVYFSNVKFLREIQLESKSKSRLKELLILLSRILAFSALVLAFAQPVFSDDKHKNTIIGSKHIGIYIDNSFSMENVNKQGPLLENAKLAAKQIVESCKNTDRFYITTNQFEGRLQRLFSKEEALTIISDIKISSSPKLFSQILMRQKEFLSGKANTFLYAISDLQKNTFNLKDCKDDSLFKLTILPIETSQVNNLYIDSCWFDSPLQQKGSVQKLNVRIQNKSEKLIESANVQLSINNKAITAAGYSVEAFSKTQVKLGFTEKNEGFNYAFLKTNDYPVSFDDELYFCYNSKISVNTLLINGKNSETLNNFKSLFGNDSLFEFRTMSENAIDYSAFKNNDLIILNECASLSSGLSDELLKFSQNGGCIVVIPAGNINPEFYASFYKNMQLPQITGTDTHAVKLNLPDYKNPFFEGVFERAEERIRLPFNTSRYLHIKNISHNQSNIYTFQNGDFFLQKSKLNNASVYLFASPLSNQYSNFTKHALFVPTFIRIAVNSIKPQPLYYYLNQNSSVFIKAEQSVAENPPRLTSVNGNINLIPEIRVLNNSLQIFPDKDLQEAGFYNLVWNDKIITNLSFNHNRIESDLSFYSINDVNEIIQSNNLKNVKLIENTFTNLGKTIQMGSDGIKLWKWMLLLSLLFISIEICLIRFIKI